MMNERQLDDLLADLLSDNPATVVSSLEAAIGVVQKIVSQTVAAFRENPERYFIAERLYRFGTLVVEPLREVFATSDDEDTKTLAALVLLRLNAEEGLPWLIDALANEDKYTCLIARVLAARRVTTATEIMITRLRTANLDQTDTIVCLLDALQKSGATLPREVKDRFAGQSVAWEVRAILESYESSSG